MKKKTKPIAEIEVPLEVAEGLGVLIDAWTEGRVLILPVKPGTTVYRVVDKCRPPFGVCPFEGGYGTSRCENGKDRGEHCRAYIEEEKYTVCLQNIGETVYITKEEAEKRRDKLNEKH